MASKLPELFFDARAGGYWLPLPCGRFLNLDKRDVAVHLRHAGLNPDEQIGPLNALEKSYLVAQTERPVDYAGPLAGHAVGAFKTTDGKSVLVTQQAKIPDMTKLRSAPFYEKFLDELLGPEQLHHFCLWLMVARKSQLKGDFRPGQMCVFAGPSNCGKSLTQAIVTEFLGGRVGKPYRYMIGETAFNSDVCAAEHWCIEDENASTDIRTRRKFGASLKEATVNQLISVHAKGREAITLPLFRRVTLSCNDEPENLMILPPLDPSIIDKVNLYRCRMAKLPAERSETWERVKKELPTFIAYVMSLKVPTSMRCARFGVAAYHNADLMEAVSQVAPETRLLALIDQILETEWKHTGNVWSGTAEELEHHLRKSAFSYAVDRLLTYSSACGTYLARLAQHHPTRFEARKVKGKTQWLIREP